jgi:hypothetical protein
MFCRIAETVIEKGQQSFLAFYAADMPFKRYVLKPTQVSSTINAARAGSFLK